MSADVDLTWEWPADRVAEQKLLVKVVEIKAEGSGFFGFKKSPSFAGNLPDPVTVKAKLISQENNLKDKTVEITLPKLELESIKANDFAVIGIIASKTCICIKHVESENVDIDKVSCP